MSSRSSTVGTMSMMCAYCVRTSPFALIRGRPGDDERVARPTTVGLALPAPEGRVARPRPTPRVVVEVLRAADLVDDLEAVLERLLGVVEELCLVGGAGRAALRARAVVRDDHDQGVVELPLLLEVVEQATEVVVGMAQEAGEDLHVAAVQPACVGRERRPVGDVRVVAGQLRVGRQDPELLLARERPLAVGVPAVIELAGVPVRPLLRDVVRRVGGAEGEVQVEGLVGVDLLGVGDELDRLVDQVLGEVVALLRGSRRLDLVVVVHEVRIPLARVAAQEAVEPLEAAGQGPARVRPRRRLFVARRQVPLAHGVGVVAASEPGSRAASRSRTA